MKNYNFDICDLEIRAQHNKGVKISHNQCCTFQTNIKIVTAFLGATEVDSSKSKREMLNK